jgi:phosphoribosylaminoimidazole (AIR) synthetase
VRSGKVKALAHITGGGLVENVPRVLPDDLAADFDARNWPLPPVFGWMMRAGGIADAEMARVFNCGLGMVAVVAPNDVAEVQAILKAEGETVFQAGKILLRATGAPGSMVRETATTWPG